MQGHNVQKLSQFLVAASTYTQKLIQKLTKQKDFYYGWEKRNYCLKKESEVTTYSRLMR